MIVFLSIFIDSSYFSAFLETPIHIGSSEHVTTHKFSEDPKIEIINTFFEKCQAEDGGALKLRSLSVFLENCIFVDNFAKNKGGSICIIDNKDSKMDYSAISSSSAESSGAMDVVATECQVLNSNFSKNSAIQMCTVLQASSILTIRESRFADNLFCTQIGILNVWGTVLCSDSLFSNQSVSRYAAGINIHSSNSESSVIFCIFKNLLSKERGSAIYIHEKGPGIGIRDCIIDGYEAQSFFGSVIIKGNVTFVVSQSGVGNKIVLGYLLIIVPLLIVYALVRMYIPLIRAKKKAKKFFKA